MYRIRITTADPEFNEQHDPLTGVLLQTFDETLEGARQTAVDFLGYMIRNSPESTVTHGITTTITPYTPQHP